MAQRDHSEKKNKKFRVQAAMITDLYIIQKSAQMMKKQHQLD